MPFHVNGFGTALLGALIITVVSWLLNVILPDDPERRAPNHLRRPA